MALLDSEQYANYRRELLRKYKHLLKSLGAGTTQDKLDLVREAFDLASRAHANQHRKSGEPYIFHPLAVAQIVVGELGLGATSSACALMHDVVEDTDVTIEDIEHKFGNKIANIIAGLTKISSVFDTVEKDKSLQAENFKKMLLTLSEDLRVILIKLCDRLHNMRTLESVKEKTKLKIASETLYIYAPLAHRLGLNAIKTELEDLAFKNTEPEFYREIAQSLAESKNSREKYIKEFIEPLKKDLLAANLNVVEIKGRPKSIFSIAQKMKKQQIPFERVFDAFAIRIIIDAPVALEKADCWKAYAIVTENYRSLANRQRDWLSNPKSNGYEALHITVLGPNNRWVEVQIRTKRMDDIAERGLAAHWRYKDKNTTQKDSNSKFEKQSKSFDDWLGKVKEILENKELEAVDLVDEFRFNILGEEIYVFTPKGDVKDLPFGATALDFAFSVHSEVGWKTIGAKVNNKLVPINHSLKNGDIVEILTTQKPRANVGWLEIVKSGRAKSKIREFLRTEKTRLSEEGKEIIQRKFKNQKIEFTEKNIKIIASQFGYDLVSEFYHDLAEGKVKSEKISISSILVNFEKEQIRLEAERKILAAENENQKKRKREKEEQKKRVSTIIIGDDFEMDYSLASCCKPIPGDSIFGFITIADGVKIHRTDCPNGIRLMSQYGYRIIPTAWRITGYNSRFEAKIAVRGIDDVGIVSRIADVISKELEVNMKSIRINALEDGTFEGELEVFISDNQHLLSLMDKLTATHKYIEVKRLDEGPAIK